MEFPPLIEGRLLRRYKRFLADVQVGEEVVVAHCPNPGSMKTMNQPGARVWLSRSSNPKRKLAYTWELIESEGAMTLVNTQRANMLVAEALQAGMITELAEYTSLRTEIPYGKSRIDFCLELETGSCYVEVKNVTMADGPCRAAFPDSVTVRGTKHLRELMEMVAIGTRAVLLYCCSREGTSSIRPADEIDATYGRTLREAKMAGVELLAYVCATRKKRNGWEMFLDSKIPIMLDEVNCKEET